MQFSIFIQELSLSRESALLDFRQGAATTQESHNTDRTHRGQSLEKIPAGVVEEENALERNDGTKEERVGRGGSAQSLGQVVYVGTESDPSDEQDGQRSSNRGSKHERDHLGRVARVLLEDVVNLVLFAVADRRLGDGEGNVGVALDFDVENVSLVGLRRTE